MANHSLGTPGPSVLKLSVLQGLILSWDSPFSPLEGVSDDEQHSLSQQASVHLPGGASGLRAQSGTLGKEGLRHGQVGGGAVYAEAHPCPADRELEKAPTGMTLGKNKYQKNI